MKLFVMIVLMITSAVLIYLTCDGDIAGTIGFPIIIAYCFVEHQMHERGIYYRRPFSDNIEVTLGWVVFLLFVMLAYWMTNRFWHSLFIGAGLTVMISMVSLVVCGALRRLIRQ